MFNNEILLDYINLLSANKHGRESVRTTKKFACLYITLKNHLF